MFMGEYEHALDDKGRIIIPNKFREQLGEHFVMTLGSDGCLYIYPDEAWQEFAKKLSELPGTKEARQAQRYFLAGAVECEPDKQGRVGIPQRLREHAGIMREVVSVGMLNKIEIWSRERWNDANSLESVDSITDNLAGYGLKF